MTLSKDTLNKYRNDPRRLLDRNYPTGELLEILKVADPDQIRKLPIKEFAPLLIELNRGKTLEEKIGEDKYQRIVKLLQWEDTKDDAKHYSYILANIILLAMIATILYFIINSGDDGKWSYVLDSFGYLFIAIMAYYAIKNSFFPMAISAAQSLAHMYDGLTKESEPELSDITPAPPTLDEILNS